MPIYEYRCSQCGQRESKFWRSISAVNQDNLICSTCGSKRMTRLVSKVRVLRGGGGTDSGAGAGAGMGEGGDLDPALMREMEGLDESDPRALGRFMRKMAAESGESLGPEFDEVVGRLEKGEDPEKIERDMGDLLGAPEGPDGGGGMMGMGDESGLPASPTEATPTVPDAKSGARRRPKVAKASKPTQAARKSKSAK